ncbi:phosphatase PAP2 family protein [Burkholderia sp. L27(2015)]|uniref:phosphatase PAP2 family protein n=1 Tax=Burkholderia sp. L27(2015) TaxID=1641858 RepID=UPI00131AD4E4|nr:phosphatase PAP2 family protein [Burkholderia sp. L27(2015)]
MSEIDLSKRPVKSYFHPWASILLSPHARLNALAWATVMAVILIDYGWMRQAGFTVSAGSVTRSVTKLLVPTCVMLILRGIAFMPRYSKGVVRLRIHNGCVILHAVVLMSLFAQAAVILQNLGVSLARPLIDHELIALDAALGFHWPDLLAWQMRHHVSSVVLATIYLSYVPQVALTIVALVIAGRADDLADFMLLFMAIAIATILISAPFPASDPLIHFGLLGPHEDTPWSQFYALREGSMSIFDLDKRQGLISMPSLHAAHAVLFAYAVRHIRWLFPVSIVWNVAMAYSAIPFGAHYLVDIIAGVVLAAASIAIARYLKRRRGVEFLEPSIQPTQ